MKKPDANDRKIVAYRLAIFGGNNTKALLHFNDYVERWVKEGFQPWGEPVARAGYGHCDDQNFMPSEICQAFVKYHGG